MVDIFWIYSYCNSWVSHGYHFHPTTYSHISSTYITNSFQTLCFVLYSSIACYLKLCGVADCYIVYNQILTTCDWVINTGLPIVTIIVANATLVIRFINQKHRLQRRFSWKKQRRMILQLLAISGLYLIACFPSLIIGIILQINLSSFLFEILTDYTSDLIYFVSLLLPWVCLGLLSEFMKWIRKYFRRGRIIPNTVATI